MTYQPWNRSGLAPLGDLAFTAGGAEWFVDDIDSQANPIVYGSPATTLRVMRDHVGFVACTDRGAFLKWPPRRGASLGRVRHFRTREAAAEYAMTQAEHRA